MKYDAFFVRADNKVRWTLLKQMQYHIRNHGRGKVLSSGVGGGGGGEGGGPDRRYELVSATERKAYTHYSDLHSAIYIPTIKWVPGSGGNMVVGDMTGLVCVCVV